MIQRYVVSALAGALITFGLFFLMQQLIAMADARPKNLNKGKVIEFVRVKRDQQLQTKDREIPDKKPPGRYLHSCRAWRRRS